MTCESCSGWSGISYYKTHSGYLEKASYSAPANPGAWH